MIRKVHEDRKQSVLALYAMTGFCEDRMRVQWLYHNESPPRLATCLRICLRVPASPRRLTITDASFGP